MFNKYVLVKTIKSKYTGNGIGYGKIIANYGNNRYLIRVNFYKWCWFLSKKITLCCIKINNYYIN